MRKKDPVGRNISNAYSGWQSNDGCERHPAFTKIMRVLKDIYNNEICGFHAINTGKIQISIGNSWANINDTGSYGINLIYIMVVGIVVLFILKETVMKETLLHSIKTQK